MRKSNYFILCSCIPTMLLAEPVFKPSYEVGVAASYEPNVVSNHSVIRAFGRVNVPIEKASIGVGVESNYSSQSPTGVLEGMETVKGYEQTQMEANLSYQVHDSTNVSLFAVKPIHYNEKKFGKANDLVSYGGSVQWVDSQNFSIQATIAKTDYKKQEEGVSLGNVLQTGIRFKFGLSPKAQFFLGAVHRKQKASSQVINGQSVKIDKKTSGVAAILGTEYSFDRNRRHNIDFEMQTGIGDLGGYLSTGYRYAF